jgi:hypothetical protein
MFEWSNELMKSEAGELLLGLLTLFFLPLFIVFGEMLIVRLKKRFMRPSPVLLPGAVTEVVIAGGGRDV